MSNSRAVGVIFPLLSIGKGGFLNDGGSKSVWEETHSEVP